MTAPTSQRPELVGSPEKPAGQVAPPVTPARPAWNRLEKTLLGLIVAGLLAILSLIGYWYGPAWTHGPWVTSTYTCGQEDGTGGCIFHTGRSWVPSGDFDLTNRWR